MEILVKGLPSTYESEHMVRLFFPKAPLRQNSSTKGDVAYIRATKSRVVVGLRYKNDAETVCIVKWVENENPTAVLYHIFVKVMKTRPPWGMLTGVRPLNLYRKMLKSQSEQDAANRMKNEYDVSEEKCDLLTEIERRQRPILKESQKNSYSLYISIPFCPTRCSYCSFVSRTVDKESHLMDEYLNALKQELAATARAAHGLKLESVYIGGGTPTSLNLSQLDSLLSAVNEYFKPQETREYTVEAGRPDCTDVEKLQLLKRYGVSRISINPQTFCDEVLVSIGRKHTAEDIRRCYENARNIGHNVINMDLIAGLPKDTEESFSQSLDEAIRLRPENITLHSLTKKRASEIVLAQKEEGMFGPSSMIKLAYPRLRQAGYVPYYLYRQKSGVDNLENTGWTLQGNEGLYNIFIMEEEHTILAAGAGASTKLVLEDKKIIKRQYNHKFAVDYIMNIEEMLHRKEGVKKAYAGYLDS